MSLGDRRVCIRGSKDPSSCFKMDRMELEGAGIGKAGAYLGQPWEHP